VYFIDGKPLQVMLQPPPPLGPQIRGHLKLLVLAYTLIRTRQRYHDPGAGYYDPRQRDKLAHRFQARIERLTSITKP
jgi:hypothetical protein